MKHFSSRQKKVLFSISLLLSLCSLSCNKEVVVPPKTDIYMVGEEWVHGVSVAIVWRNGTALELSDGKKNAAALCVFAKGKDYYTAGFEESADGRPFAKLWKNGYYKTIANNMQPSVCYSLFVSGNDEYLAGYEENKDGVPVAKYWKNGVGVELSDGKLAAKAVAIYVVEDTVYVATVEEDDNGMVTARYFVNGISKVIATSPKLAIRQIAADATNVWVGGTENGIVKLWTNGIEKRISPPDSYSATSGNFLFKSSDVFVAGCASFSHNGVHARYWKNGIDIHMESYNFVNIAFEVSGITVVNDDVYLVGSLNGRAVYWKNTKPVSLVTSDALGGSRVHGVFSVVP